MHRHTVAALAPVVVLLASACTVEDQSDYYTPDAAATRLSAASCERLSGCELLAEGHTEASCTVQLRDELKKKTDKDATRSACTIAQVDACAADIRKAACASLVTGTLPASCDGC